VLLSANDRCGARFQATDVASSETNEERDKDVGELWLIRNINVKQFVRLL